MEHKGGKNREKWINKFEATDWDVWSAVKPCRETESLGSILG